MEKEKTILSVFSGREDRMKVLMKYLYKALDLKMIDEVHLWNYIRNPEDFKYISSISNIMRTSSINYNYSQVFTNTKNNRAEFRVKASNDIHIMIKTNRFRNLEYEIVLGGWGNTKSIIRRNGIEIVERITPGIANPLEFINIEIIIYEFKVEIIVDGHVCLTSRMEEPFHIDDVFIKTGHGSVGIYQYETVKNHGIYFMDTCRKKPWHDYYEHYQMDTYVNDIIIKCDDDIVFLDLNRLPLFIMEARTGNQDLLFANTINNGVSAYFQQTDFNVIPRSIGNFEYPPGGLHGSLWESGVKAENLHKYFIDNYKSFIQQRYKKRIQIDTRFSINFFAIKGSNWKNIIDVGYDDELILTITKVRNHGFINVLYSDFYVSHLSFYKQEENQQMNISELINNYDSLFNSIHS